MSAVAVELSRGVLPAAELRQRIGASPPTLMRALRQAPDVVRIGRGRASRYGLRQAWPNLDASEFPVFVIAEDGRAQTAGRLVTLAARQTAWLPAGVVSDGLPAELADARPSGFLGRHFAALHADLRLPLLLTEWSDHHILLAMTRRGEDLPGNLIAGDESFARWQDLPVVARTREEYPDLADATIAGHPPGSSAGGERPKFGVCVDGRHRLVKFAARGGPGDVAARRWCDLLVLEAIALLVVSSRGVPAAGTEVVESSSHVFLESERFDRVGLRGRTAVLSLAAVHDDPADSWARAAARLRQSGRLRAEQARRVQWLDAFGAFIGNTDRHQYNLVFFSGGRDLQLAPAFDQASMRYAPSADGQVQSPVLPMPHATSDTLEVWEDARAAAREFWERAGNDERVSADMRRLCAVNLSAVRGSA